MYCSRLLAHRISCFGSRDPNCFVTQERVRNITIILNKQNWKQAGVRLQRLRCIISFWQVFFTLHWLTTQTMHWKVECVDEWRPHSHTSFGWSIPLHTCLWCVWGRSPIHQLIDCFFQTRALFSKLFLHVQRRKDLQWHLAVHCSFLPTSILVNRRVAILDLSSESTPSPSSPSGSF